MKLVGDTMRDERKNRRHRNNGQVTNDGRHGSAMPVYHISIVAEMVETHPQTLRMYERMGLIIRSARAIISACIPMKTWRWCVAFST
jgi:hypothetical protein